MGSVIESDCEKTAIEKELFEMLSIVYSEIIELSHELILIDIDKKIVNISIKPSATGFKKQEFNTDLFCLF